MGSAGGVKGAAKKRRLIMRIKCDDDDDDDDDNDNHNGVYEYDRMSGEGVLKAAVFVPTKENFSSGELKRGLMIMIMNHDRS